MAQLLNRVERGEIITADEWNLMVDAVNELLQTGQTGGIQITALLPAGTEADPIRIGTLQQISGQSFGYTIGQSMVTFTGPGGPVVVRRSDMLTGSSDSRLLFLMPAIPGLPDAGDTLPMRVDNGVAHDLRSVFVQPVVSELEGDVFVDPRGDVSPNPNPNPLQSGAPAEFFYRVQTGINMPATFNLSADIPNATTTIPPQLVSSIVFRQPNGNPITGNRIEMGREDTRNIVVRIPQIPASFASQSFTLVVRASSGNVAESDARTFTVGQPVTPADPNIGSDRTGAEVFDATSGQPDLAGGSLAGSTITLASGRQMILSYNVTLSAAGSYDVTIGERSGAALSGWTLAVVNPSTLPINVPSDGDTTVRLVMFGITRTATATAGGNIVVTIQRQGASSDWHEEFQLALL